MMEMLKTGFWFLQRPRFWGHAAALSFRKFSPSVDNPTHQERARAWAEERAVPAGAALKLIGFDAPGDELPVFPVELQEEGSTLASRAAVRMGGPADVGLLYAATIRSHAKKVVETGVAYGWSSLAVLAAMDQFKAGRLISVDMPYPKMNNESWVGIAVPERFKQRWTLIREPDRFGLKKALSLHGGTIDLCHYDSDKSSQGRAYAYPLLWNALKPGGIFISDDIQDNLAFRDFVEAKSAPFAVTKSQGKYVGIARKA